MSTKVCPVVKAIGEIRGGGIYSDDAEETNNNLIKIGGSDSEVEFVCDDMSFYIMSRKMELARFELSKPNLAVIEAKYNAMFRDVVGIDYSALYTRIIDRALKKKYIYDQFVQLVDLLGSMEQTIAAKVDALGRKGQPINISLPDIFLLPHVDTLIVYRPDILADTMNKIIDYVNKININALLKEPLNIHIPRVEKFAGSPPDMKTKIEPVQSTSSPEEFLAGMHKILDQELVVAKYIQEIEKYQCEVINHVNKVYDACKKIIANM